MHSELPKHSPLARPDKEIYRKPRKDDPGVFRSTVTEKIAPPPPDLGADLAQESGHAWALQNAGAIVFNYSRGMSLKRLCEIYGRLAVHQVLGATP